MCLIDKKKPVTFHKPRKCYSVLEQYTVVDLITNFAKIHYKTPFAHKRINIKHKKILKVQNMKEEKSNWLDCLDEGFHRFLSLKPANKYLKLFKYHYGPLFKIAEWEIPIGSKVIYGKDDFTGYKMTAIKTNQIKFIKILNS